jgi:hypothetical protein
MAEKAPAAKREEKALPINDRLTRDLPMDRVRKRSYHKVHLFRMEAGTTYTIDLISREFDAYLRVEDSSEKGLAEDDDSGGNQNSRIFFTAPRTDTYRLVATTFVDGASGEYTLIIQPGRVVGLPAPGPLTAPALYGDLTITVGAPPMPVPPHGYVEYRLTIANGSQDSHRVQVVYPKFSNPFGIHLRSLQRTLDVGPASQAVVSLLQPDLPLGGSTAEAILDGQPQLQPIAVVNAPNRGSYIANGRGSSHSYPAVILCIRNEEGFALQRNWSRANLPGLGQSVPRAGGRTVSHGGFQFASRPLTSWSANWLAYSGFDGIVATSRDLAFMEPEVQSALQQYVACGGSLLVMGSWTAPKSWELAREIGKGVKRYDPGFGQCLVIDNANVDRWSKEQWRLIVESWRQSGVPWMDMRTPTEANTVFPVVEHLTVPVRSMFVLMVVFAVAIGPVNLYVLARKKRRMWLLWTVPVISLITCLAVLGSMVVMEGWEGHVRSEGITVLDEASQQAATIGWIAFYTPITPGDGLHFSGQTELTAQLASDNTRIASRPRSIDWTAEQHLDSGWLTARVPAHFVLRKSERRLEHIAVRKTKDSTYAMVNGFNTAIRAVRIMSKSGKVYAADTVPAGQEAELKAAGAAIPPTKLDRLRKVYLDDWLETIKDVGERPEELLRPGRYVATLEAAPFIENGLHRAAYRQGRSVVVGIMKEPLDEN